MTNPVFLFGSFSEVEAKSYQSRETPPGKKNQPTDAPVVGRNGVHAVKAPAPSSVVVKQNGNAGSPQPSSAVGKQNGHAKPNLLPPGVVTQNGPAKQNPPPVVGKQNGHAKPNPPPVVVSQNGHWPPAASAVLLKQNGHAGPPQRYTVNQTGHVEPKPPSVFVKQDGHLPSVKNPVNGIAPSSGRVHANGRASGAKTHPPKPQAAVVGGGAQSPSKACSPSKASNGGGVENTLKRASSSSSVGSDQPDWLVVSSLDISTPRGGDSPPVLEENGSKSGETERVLDKNGSGEAATDGESETLPTKLLPKSWAALVGVPGDSNVLPKQFAGPKSKGKGFIGSPVPKSPPQQEVRVPVTELSGDIWLRSLRQAEVSGRRMQPRGLINTGNSCFLNSTMQAMLSCSAFIHLLQVLKARTIPETGYPTLQAFVKFSNEFVAPPTRSLPKSKRDGDGKVNVVSDVGRPFAPEMFDVVLQSFTPDQPPRGTGHNRQEDAQEFLSFVIDRMHEEILRLQGKDSPSAQSVSSFTSGEDEDWEMVGPKNRSAVTRTHTFRESAITDLFGGQLRSVVKTKGNKASATVQPFLVLHLDIVPEVVHSVEDALRFFAAPESLEGYKPSTAKVGEVVSASKSVKIQTLPRVLILHLMRFSYGSEGSSKLHKPVQFPFDLTLGRELLALTTSSGNEIRKYELFATLSHHGKDPSVGHYTADSKQASGQWLRFDDGVVSVVGVPRVQQEQAYVLFYKRAGL